MEVRIDLAGQLLNSPQPKKFMGMTHSPKRIQELDALRGICVFFVIASHLVRYAHAIPASPSVNKVAGFLGWIGVNIFFTISGFIITKTMLDERRSTGSVSLFRFYIRRFFRIIPAYWFYILVVSLLAVSGCLVLNPFAVMWSLLFLSNITPLMPDPETVGWFSAHSWSLSVEEQYYLLFPLIIWIILRGNIRAVSVVLGFIYLIVALNGKIAFELGQKFPDTHFNFSFLSSFKFIIAGVLIAFYRAPLGMIAKRTSVLVPLALIVILCLKRIGALAFHGLDTSFLLGEALIVASIVLWIVENRGSRFCSAGDRCCGWESVPTVCIFGSNYLLRRPSSISGGG